MKVAFVSQPFEFVTPPVEGGSLPIWTYQVSRRLRGQADIIVYVRGKERRRGADQVYEGVRYRYVPIGLDNATNKLYGLQRKIRKMANVGFENVRRPRFASQFQHLGYALWLARDIRRENVDIVHISNYSQFATVIRALNPKVKILLHMACEWLSQLDPGWIERRLRRVDLIIGCSDHVTERTRQAFPHLPIRFRTIFNGVDTEEYGNRSIVADPGDKVIILFVGRVSPEKGIHVLLDAMRKVVQRFPKVTLRIVGPKGSAPPEFLVSLNEDPAVRDLARFYDKNVRHSYSVYLEEQAAKGLSDNVEFVGRVPHSQVLSQYAEADILVNPSLSEAFGMSLVEGMASGTPVVATRIGGMKEVVDEGTTGFLAEANDPDNLAEVLCRLIADNSLRKHLGENGVRRAKELFSWDQIAARVLATYRQILYEESPA